MTYIGRFCPIANNVCIAPGNHFINRCSTYPMAIRVFGDYSVDSFPEKKRLSLAAMFGLEMV